MEDPPAACRHGKDALGRLVVADGLGRLCGLVVRSPSCFCLCFCVCVCVCSCFCFLLFAFAFAFTFSFAFAFAFAVAFAFMILAETTTRTNGTFVEDDQFLAFLFLLHQT